MNGRRSINWAEVLVSAAIGAILALVSTLAVTAWLEKRKTKQKEREAPEIVLKQAGRERRQLTEGDLGSAAGHYKWVLADLDTNTSLDPEAKRRLRAGAYSGLSRTYADWATLRYWRGFSRGDNPKLAEKYVNEAVGIAPNDVETAIALVYTYESFGDSDASKKSAASNKVNELLAKGINNLDTKYLAWLSKANEQVGSFPNELRAEDILEEVRVLVDVGLHFAKLAEKAESAEKEKYIDDAERFLARAALVSPDNPVVLFAKGYLSTAKRNGNATEARDYYAEAIRQEIEFPRARNNLGFTYATLKDYRNAQDQFEAAAKTVGAPPASVRLWLYNLASASLEVGDIDKVCKSSQRAYEITDAKDDLRTFIGLAVCDYLNKKVHAAITNFRRAVQLGKKQGVDLTNISWFEQQKAGPKELEIDQALIQMAK